MFSVSVKEALGKGFHKLESKKKILLSNEKVKMPNILPQSQNYTLTPTEQKPEIPENMNEKIENTSSKNNQENNKNNK